MICLIGNRPIYLHILFGHRLWCLKLFLLHLLSCWSTLPVFLCCSVLSVVRVASITPIAVHLWPLAARRGSLGFSSPASCSHFVSCSGSRVNWIRVRIGSRLLGRPSSNEPDLCLIREPCLSSHRFFSCVMSNFALVKLCEDWLVCAVICNFTVANDVFLDTLFM